MPQLKIRYNFHTLALSLIIAHLIFFIACIDDAIQRIPPKAFKGVLDLTDWDFQNDGPIDLNGEWEFYWQHHLKPEDFILNTPPRETKFIDVPGYWKGYQLAGEKLPGYGYATYRLKVILNELKGPLALRIIEISNAYTIYLNGKALASLGQAGRSLETTVPRKYPKIVAFRPETTQLEIIFQVSNFHHRRGGIWEKIQLGMEKDIRKVQERKLSFDLFLFGSISLMALYHLGFFIVRKQDLSPFYFSVFCSLIALRLLTTGSRYLNHIFPYIDWELMIKLEYLSYYLAVPAFLLFMKSIFPDLSRRFLHLVLLLGIGFTCVVIFTPARIYSYTLNAYEVITILTLIYGLYIVFTSLIKKNIEAFILLIGFIILCITTINDVLHVERIVHTGFFTPFGLFIFILSWSFLLSFRFSKVLTTVETQEKELRNALGSLKTEMVERVQAEEALRESEEKYRTILHSIEEGYYEVDLAGNMTFFNDTLCRHLGYVKEELLGMNNRQFMSAESARRIYATFNNVYKTGQSANAIDSEMIAKNGSKKFVELSVSLIRNLEGRPTGFRGVARDITEHKKAEEQARFQQQQLMQASKMVALGTLVSGVAHEINNPNNFIMLNSPILKEAWDNAMPILEKYYEENGDFIIGGMNYTEMRKNIPALFSGISDGANRIKRIIDDLKNYVRKDTTDLTQSVAIDAVIDSAVTLLSNMIKKSTSHFSIKYGPNLPPICGNFQHLEQVIINLIQNACQTLSDAKEGIFVSVRLIKEKSTIVIKVRDEGKGIAPDKIQHITDPFYTTKLDSGGVGLGLSISSKIVEEHGGTLHFKSEMGVGTIATITLPIDRTSQLAKGMY